MPRVGQPHGVDYWSLYTLSFPGSDVSLGDEIWLAVERLEEGKREVAVRSKISEKSNPFVLPLVSSFGQDLTRSSSRSTVRPFQSQRSGFQPPETSGQSVDHVLSGTSSYQPSVVSVGVSIDLLNALECEALATIVVRLGILLVSYFGTAGFD
ncbi:RNA ligase/cyclic nucleotide phosphodiesterase family protein [Dorcoceras hygrometricum]|uniref:RNA ligase/cyclic nucleotide phosphodiesterase family protein n=1 Tax=Dorcoceras hygrometricum TaxID=472368 RepID=A0A2Z7CNQ9_9LAMI|nr:RNA ligase/cyclic nucleotide phosphodiesterase family protein [Dorcoceras hygrometricum]